MDKHVERRYEKGKERRVVQVLDLVHSYLIGDLPTPSYGNSRYVLTFIDDFSTLLLGIFSQTKIWSFFSKFGKPWLRMHVGTRSMPLGMTMARSRDDFKEPYLFKSV